MNVLSESQCSYLGTYSSVYWDHSRWKWYYF